MSRAVAPAAVRLGDFFFRWRSYLPLFLLPVAVYGVARFQYRFGTHATDLEWEAACLLVALAGLALRVWTAGVVPPGTSGRNTRSQKASVLNTTGPYSVVRHPLYLANTVIAVALAAFVHSEVVLPVIGLLIAGYYACMARREDLYLRQKFGPAFEAWSAGVPAFWPALDRYRPADRRWSWRAAVRREFYGLALLLTAPLGLDIIEDYYEVHRLVLDPYWTVTAAFGATIFLLVRYLKKHTRLLAAVQGGGGPGL